APQVQRVEQPVAGREVMQKVPLPEIPEQVLPVPGVGPLETAVRHMEEPAPDPPLGEVMPSREVEEPVSTQLETKPTAPLQRLEQPVASLPQHKEAVPPEIERDKPPEASPAIEGLSVSAEAPVQRGVGPEQEMPIPTTPELERPTLPPTRDRIQRQRLESEDETPAPAPTERELPPPLEAGPSEVPLAGLETGLVARTASQQRVPLTELPRPIDRAEREMPALPQARVQARFQEEGESTPSGWRAYERTGPSPQVMPLPLQRSLQETAPVVPASPGSTQGPETQAPMRSEVPVLRLPLVTPHAVQIVQRVEEEEAAPVAGGMPAEEEEPGLNLDDLAGQVYPLIKRMLAVERERIWGR
ncbi:hypothetical protein ACFLT5_04315, partial [Chloroflexota bacterium]